MTKKDDEHHVHLWEFVSFTPAIIPSHYPGGDLSQTGAPRLHDVLPGAHIDLPMSAEGGKGRGKGGKGKGGKGGKGKVGKGKDENNAEPAVPTTPLEKAKRLSKTVFLETKLIYIQLNGFSM